MSEVTAATVLCLCGWVGKISDIPVDFSIENFLICPKCGSEDLIFDVPEIGKWLYKRRNLLKANIGKSVIYSSVAMEDILKSEILLFVEIGVHTYFFKTTGRLALTEDNFEQLSSSKEGIDKLAADRAAAEKHDSFTKIDGSIDRIWGTLNFATLVVFQDSIISLIESELSGFENNAFASFAFNKGKS